MLAGFGMWAGISYLLYHQLFGKKTDREKIDITFKNVRFGFKEQFPQHIYTDKKDGFTVYGYSVPYGLVDNPKLEYILEKTLNRPVKIEMESHLKVKVYNNGLPSEIDYNWKGTKGWTVPVGYSIEGLILHDFDKIPHMGITGTTRYGKTVLLKLMFYHLIQNHEEVEFYIIDLKRLEFSRYRNLKQVKMVARDQEEAKECLQMIDQQMEQTMRFFEEKGINNIADTNIKRRTFIIVDEGGQVNKKLHPYLDKISMIGGGIGYRLIFATQYGTGDVFPRQVKQNADAKIAFRLPTETASRVAIDESGAEDIDNVGRAIYRTAKRKLIQVPYIDDKDIERNLRGYEVDTTEGTAKKRGTDTLTLE